MVDGMVAGNAYGGNTFDLLQGSAGETVTIFTTSGGQSGSGFTGVVLAVNPCFVRLITHIGPAPGCALGNCCGGGVVTTFIFKHESGQGAHFHAEVSYGIRVRILC